MASTQMTRGQTLTLAVAISLTAGWALVGCGSSGGTRAGGDAGSGPRDSGTVAPGTDAGMMSTGTICEETCTYSMDMECDDGAAGSTTSACAFGTDCADCGPRNRADCMPSCGTATCGDDGCGGSCGTCTAPEACMAGTCGVCMPDCGTRTCGDDGCGGTCGDCGAPMVCSSGACRAPDCAGRVCGSDGAGGRCGTMDGACAMGMGCRDGACVACDCTGRTCGTATGCDSCGICGEGMLCDRLVGACSATATPAGCNNTCPYSGDNECDDGRAGSHTSLCDPGTDCADCGPM